jgi:glycosyltransferase involved in cell wall biosynthesis
LEEGKYLPHRRRSEFFK